ATEIAREFGLKHKVISLNVTGQEYERFKKFLARNTYYRHGPSVVFLCSRMFTRGTHLRSNLAEIGRAFYRKIGGPLPEVVSGAEMATAYNAKLSGNVVVRRAFDEFYDLTDFGNRYNYDGYD